MSTEPINERLRLIRFRMKREQSRFADEIRLVPRQLVRVMIVLYIVALVVGISLDEMGVFRDGARWPEGALPFVAGLAVAGVVTAAAVPLAIIAFLTAYVNRDAKRRGMNSGAWTLVVIMLLPAWIATGFVIYFLLRDPLPYHCTQCGTLVSARYNYCPVCRCNLRPTCPQCQREVSDRDRYCPYCGSELLAGGEPAAGTLAS